MSRPGPVVIAVGEEFARLVLEDPDRYPPERLVGTFEGMLPARRLDDGASPEA